MRTTTYALHILAGSIGLVTGFVALYSAKGAPLHRKAGRVFVGAMLTMCVLGALIAAVLGRAPAVNVPAAVLTAYLVITAFTTVRPTFRGSRVLHAVLMVVALRVRVRRPLRRNRRVDRAPMPAAAAS